jgi:aspartyl-tRNA(Asn)/glutamyl-tRNA(Gln) amidotransferase subunit A
VINRLDAAGALDLGRLQLAEFALSPTGYNERYGHARNPWNPGLCAGRLVVGLRRCRCRAPRDRLARYRYRRLAAHPGAMCGLIGLKPTWGLVPTDGVMPLAASLDCTGTAGAHRARCRATAVGDRGSRL